LIINNNTNTDATVKRQISERGNVE